MYTCTSRRVFTFVKRSFKFFFRCFLDHVLGSFGVFVIIFRTCGFFLVMRCAGDGNDLVVALDLHDGNTLGRAGAYADGGGKDADDDAVFADDDDVILQRYDGQRGNITVFVDMVVGQTLTASAL